MHRVCACESIKNMLCQGMGRQVQGGIVEHRELERFTASAANVAVKDQIDLMSRNCFSLKNRVAAQAKARKTLLGLR